MTTTSLTSGPAATPPHKPSLRAQIARSPYGTAHQYEIVHVYSGDNCSGVLTLPPEAAADLVARLNPEDSPAASFALVTAKIAGQVRYWLDRDYSEPADETPDWTAELIELIRNADEGQRARLGRAYPAHVVCVSLAERKDGLADLARLHEQLLAAKAPVTPQGG